MDQSKGYGIQSEGRSLCLNCAEMIYGNSLDLYANSGEIQVCGRRGVHSAHPAITSRNAWSMVRRNTPDRSTRRRLPGVRNASSSITARGSGDHQEIGRTDQGKMPER